MSTKTYATILTIGCLLSFLIGREYEYNRLTKTYLSQIETDPETGFQIEQRMYYK